MGHYLTVSAGVGNNCLHYANSGGAFKYKLNGELIDKEKYIIEQLKSGDIYTVKRIMKQVGIHYPDPNLAKQLIERVDAELRHQNWRDNRSQAFGWRLRGEILRSDRCVGRRSSML